MKLKYGSHKTSGMASKLEKAVYDILLLRERNGEIKDIKMQVPIVLQGGKRITRITWRVDFSFTKVSDNVFWLCEAKGVETDVYKMKLKLFRFKKPHPLEIWKGTYKRPFLAEVI